MERMGFGNRRNGRVDFARGIRVYIMGIDGTWRRDCMMIDVSQTGARLSIEASLEGLDLKEFFLVLSSTGLTFRRCRLVRVTGDQIGVEFLERDRPRKKSAKPQPACTVVWHNVFETEANHKDDRMSDLHKITDISVSVKSTRPLIGIVNVSTPDKEIKFEVTDEVAHKICTDLERFLTR
jgi:hypothetical protein